ncbi:isoprenylcysteine carboxylmethyltransferase family protein [Defluviimonas sp. WL0024]|uniref:Isoprenylcysteine carboxylmethyltransferase family protein n=2 Tax=Albidovulum TaxID=205889 RepID=A0ABT3IZY6_9RHOB|nr:MULTISPECIES: isoprenylcysteine carboxylmethyltransferase family protein [Defluviimonas]MCU9847166.1 isoprenylcysteine carboxylmethyltransferase family protein [Defluviimonas sp. WL0024]MCW3780966.1 isoprenylcysteine carboxylmethyltransferase family protein [Defluviimonas salinarum]
MAKDIDFPPVWLAGFAVLGGIAGKIFPVETAANAYVGSALVIAGVTLMFVAVVQMLLARTTVIPRRDPGALVTGGVFRLGRNPIYLGDALLLAGLFIAWDALVALPLVAVFMWVIDLRFIRGEEERLAEHFGEEFEAYRQRTRRWL